MLRSFCAVLCALTYFHCLLIRRSFTQLATSPTHITDDSFYRLHKTAMPHNAASCVQCHSVPVPGGSSKVTVIRLKETALQSHATKGMVTLLENAPGLDMAGDGLRVALNLLGDGYVEAIADKSLEAIAASQPRQTHNKIHGQCASATVPESARQEKAIGRFGWKAQHATLLSAIAEALNKELGSPNRYSPESHVQTSQRRAEAVGFTGDLEEMNSLASFLRSSEPVSEDFNRSTSMSAKVGSEIFNKVGCGVCHVRNIRTAPVGTVVAGGTIQVSPRFGDREIHPYSDFLLHDVGTGDGIVQNIRKQDYDAKTAQKLRTAPLWGLRYRSWLMHDGRSVTYHQAIMRHTGEAGDVIRDYINLTPVEKEQLRQFLDSL